MGLTSLQCFETLRSVPGSFHLVALELKDIHYRREYCRVVLDNQYGTTLFGGRLVIFLLFCLARRPMTTVRQR